MWASDGGCEQLVRPIADSADLEVAHRDGYGGVCPATGVGSRRQVLVPTCRPFEDATEADGWILVTPRS